MTGPVLSRRVRVGYSVVTGAWDVVVNPVAGRISDRTRCSTRWDYGVRRWKGSWLSAGLRSGSGRELSAS